MAEEEMSLATGDTTQSKTDYPTCKGTDERNGQVIPGAIQTEVSDGPKDNNVNDSVAHNAEMEVELQTERCGHSYFVDTNDTVFEESPLSKSVDFMYETKYVMLNFMSIIPPDMYRGHISASPESVGFEPQFNKKLLKSNMYLSKSKSFDTGLQNRKPHLKRLGKLKIVQKHLDSPASEDNVNYRYQNNLQKLDSPDSQRFDSDPCSPQDLAQLFEKSQSAHEFSGYSSPSHSPRKNTQSPQRQYSDVSSSGELSYMSDADDEYEEFSNASSIFSARSISSRDGFLDLRRGVHILPTLPSQSEDLDEPVGNIEKLFESIAQDSSESGHLATLPEEEKHEKRDEDDGDKVETLQGLKQAMCNVDGRGSVRQSADRSKLKLNIPCEALQLDDILVSLHTEISSELDELESEYEEALHSARDRMIQSGRPTPLTPQSEAALVLARIGDEVTVQYGDLLTAAVNRLTYQQITNLSYEQYRDIAQSVVSADIPGWRQVALLMVFGQKIIWGSVQQGHTHFRNLIEYSSQLVAEVAAEFIIKQGGWGSVMNFDPSSDAQSSGEFDTSPEMVIDYFTSHDITQVESEKCINDGQDQNGNEETCKDAEEQVSELDRTEDVDNIEPNTAFMQTLTIEALSKSTTTLTRDRYASSVGFDYVDNIDDIAEADTKSDLEGDQSVEFIEPEEVDRNVFDTENGCKETVNEEKHDKSREESVSSNNLPFMQVSKDLTSNNIPHDMKPCDYDKGSIYIRQNTPSATAFESASTHSNEEMVINSVETHAEHTSDSGIVDVTNVNIETINRSAIESDDLNEEVIKGVAVKEGAVDNTDSNGSKNVNEKNAAFTAFSTSAEAVKQPVSDTDVDVENVNNNNIFNGDFSTSVQGRDIPIKHFSDLSNVGGTNVNNNQNKMEVGLCENNDNISDKNNGEYEVDIESKEEKVPAREISDESHIPAFIKSKGVQVAALALAVVVLGISVRLATLNR